MQGKLLHPQSAMVLVVVVVRSHQAGELLNLPWRGQEELAHRVAPSICPAS